MKPTTKRERATIDRLVGRTIVAADPRCFNGKRHGAKRCHDWRLTLDDGTTVRLVVEETDIGEYGVDLALSRRRS